MNIYYVYIRHLDGTRQFSRAFTTKRAAERWKRFVGGTLPCAYLKVEIELMRGELRPRPIAACPYCGDPSCSQQCVNPPEPDDFETYNQLEALDYLDEGGEA